MFTGLEGLECYEMFGKLYLLRMFKRRGLVSSGYSFRRWS